MFNTLVKGRWLAGVLGHAILYLFLKAANNEIRGPIKWFITHGVYISCP